jgi:hypothetical protein
MSIITCCSASLPDAWPIDFGEGRKRILLETLSKYKFEIHDLQLAAEASLCCLCLLDSSKAVPDDVLLGFGNVPQCCCNSSRSQIPNPLMRKRASKWAMLRKSTQPSSKSAKRKEAWWMQEPQLPLRLTRNVSFVRGMPLNDNLSVDVVQLLSLEFQFNFVNFLLRERCRQANPQRKHKCSKTPEDLVLCSRKVAKYRRKNAFWRKQQTFADQHNATQSKSCERWTRGPTKWKSARHKRLL